MPASFQFLKVGEVRPRGWLLEQLRNDLTHGYAPILDQLTDRVEIPVFDARHKSTMAKPKIGEVWWNGETTGNWLDGLIRLAYLADHAPAKSRVDALVAQVLAMQDDDGYFGPYPRGQRFESPIAEKNGDFWVQACLLRGLLAYHEFTGRSDVLTAVTRAAKLALAQYSRARPYWGARIPRGGPGHNLMFIDVCEWLYRLTQDPCYVEFARFLYDTCNECQDVFEADTLLRNLAEPGKPFQGHAAHVMEHIRVPFFLYETIGDEKYRVAVENYFLKTARHTACGGGCIGDEDILGRPGSPVIGTEFCTMFELLNSLQSAVQKTGRSDLADWIELLAFNSAAGARLADGTAIQYLTCDNQSAATTAAGLGGRFKLSPTHEDVAVCCPVTAMKFFGYFTNHLWMRAPDGLVAVTYAPNVVTTTVNGVAVTIETETGYPYTDDIRFNVRVARPVRFNLRYRVPAWSTREAAGWRVESREWKDGDTVTVSFAPEVRRRIAGNGECYWQRGPLVYALPISAQRQATKQYAVPGFTDWEYTPKPGTCWDYEAASDFTYDPANQCLSGSLISEQSKTSQPVQLVPMGKTLLRRVTFPARS